MGNDMKRCLEILFDNEMMSAHREGEKIRFTKVERLLLQTFTRNRGRLLTRDMLLDAVSADGLGGSDRNIDYIVNRLRAKLKDSVKSPRFLATRYGEGYVWVAELSDASAVEAFLAVGPIYGVDGEPFEKPVGRLVEDLRHQLVKKLPSDFPVAIVRNFDPNTAMGNVEYSLELGFLAHGSLLHGSVILRSVRSRQIVKTFRLALELPLLVQSAAEKAELVAQIANGIVLHKSEIGSQRTAIPLEMSLHEASRLMSLPDQAWVASGDALARERKQNPGNPKLEVMWASHLYAKLITAGPFGGITHRERQSIEAEIETVCLECLPRAQSDPILRQCIAKLLNFVDRRHLELAENLLESAFHENMGVASIYPVLGQVRAARGLFDEALRWFDHALKTADRGSEFHVYVLVLKAETLMAAGRRSALNDVMKELAAVRPEAMLVIGLLVIGADDELAPEQKAFLSHIGPNGAAMLVDYLHKTSARHYLSALHREGVMIGLCTQLERFFGTSFMLAEFETTATTGHVAPSHEAKRIDAGT